MDDRTSGRSIADHRLIDQSGLWPLGAFVTQMGECALNTDHTVLRRACVLNGAHKLTTVRGGQRVERPPEPGLREPLRKIIGDVDLVFTQRTQPQGDAVADLHSSGSAHPTIHVESMPAVPGGNQRRVQRVPVDSAGDAHAAMIRKLSERSSHLSGYDDERVDASLGDHCPERLLEHALVYPGQSGPARWRCDPSPIDG